MDVLSTPSRRQSGRPTQLQSAGRSPRFRRSRSSCIVLRPEFLLRRGREVWLALPLTALSLMTLSVTAQPVWAQSGFHWQTAQETGRQTADLPESLPVFAAQPVSDLPSVNGDSPLLLTAWQKTELLPTDNLTSTRDLKQGHVRTADAQPISHVAASTVSAVPFYEREPAASAAVPATSAADQSTTEALIRGMSWMIVTMCLLCLTILGLRRWQKSRGLLPATGSSSRVIETLSLGPGRTISLIEMNGLRALVGCDAGGIRTIVLAPASFADEITLVGGDGLINS